MMTSAHLTAESLARAAGEMVSPAKIRRSSGAPRLVSIYRPSTCVLVCSTIILLVTVACLPLLFTTDVGVIRLLGFSGPPPEIEDPGGNVRSINSVGSALFSVREVSFLPQGVRSPSPLFLWVPAIAGTPKEEEVVENSDDTEMTLSSLSLAVLAETSRGKKGMFDLVLLICPLAYFML